MKHTLEEVFYPPIGIAHITNNITDLIKYKTKNIQKIILNTSSQPNSSPHLGTITTLMIVFSLAKKINDELSIETIVQFDELENSPNTFKSIGTDTFCKSLNDSFINGERVSDINMKQYIDIFETLKKLTDVNYIIRSYKEFQENFEFRKILNKILNEYNKFAELLSPSNHNLHIRTKCPKCNWMNKNNSKINIKKEGDNFVLKNYCFQHGDFTINTNNFNEYIDVNTQLRDLIKGALILEEDIKNNTLTIMIDGGDWSGIWDNRIHNKGLMALGYTDSPIRLFTPIILDWSGAKFSKSLYLHDNAYAKQNCAYNNYHDFKIFFGYNGFLKLWNEINTWTNDPKKFFRNYSVEYFDLILKRNKSE